MAVRLLPRAFRDEFGADIEAAFRDGVSERSGRWSRIRFTVATSVDLMRTGLRERRSPTLRAEGDRGIGRVGQSIGPGWRSSGRQAAAAIADRVLGDVRYAIRSLLKRPGYTAVAVATLSLGIGANTAVFSAVDAVLLRGLPYVDPDGLVLVYVTDRESPDGRGVMSLPDIGDVAALPGVSTLIGFRDAEVTVTSAGEPQVLRQGRVTDGIMRTFGVEPVIGRDIAASDNEPGSPLVVVIGYRFWQDRLGGSADVIGSTVELSDRSWEVVGVAPDGFGFPDGAELWTARRLDVEQCGRGCHTLYAIGRLAPGASVASVQSQLSTLASQLSASYPESNHGKLFRAVRLSEDRVADVRSGLWFVFGAAGLVLLIACANVANLLIARGEGRRGEIALRAALGASRGRLAGQMMVESLVLSMAGVAGGLLVGRAALLLVRAVPAGTLPGIEAVGLDGRVLVFTVVLGVAVALVFGASPAMRQANASPVRSFGSGGRSHGDRTVRRTRSLLLAAEVALSVLLLAGAGLLFRSFDHLYRTDLGFEADNLTRFRLVLPTTRYDTLPAVTAFYRTLEDRLSSIPGVESVGSAFGPPLGTGHMTGDVTIEGRPPAEPGEVTSASMHSVTPGHLRTYRLPLLRGRWIEASDGPDAVPVAVVSETFARQSFGYEDPVGQRFTASASFRWRAAPMWTIVGVVGDVPRSLTTAPDGDVYVPHAQYGPEDMTVTIRSRAGILPVAAIRDIVRDMDPELPLRSLGTVRDAVDAQVAPTRFYLLSVASFATLAVLLACIGLYGVVSWLVARRTSEIGIRVALGARTGSVIGLVLAQGLRPAAAGVAIGIALVLALGRLAQSVVHGVSVRDPIILGGVATLILAVVILAALVPALRASRIDPLAALRSE